MKFQFEKSIAAAVATGLMVACGGSTPEAESPDPAAAADESSRAVEEAPDDTMDELSEESDEAEPAEAADAAEAKDCCKGINECKGKGGCKTAANECKGMNECKGKGGCNGHCPE